MNLAGVAYKFGEWAGTTARPVRMAAGLIRRAGAWSWEPGAFCPEIFGWVMRALLATAQWVCPAAWSFARRRSRL